MGEYDLVAPCSDYCGGCGQYNGIICQTAKQMREFADLYGFEFRSEGVFDFKQFVKALEWFIENAECPRCKQGGGFPSCAVRKCCFEKGLRICFQCEEFPCSKTNDVADTDTTDRYRRFKEVGFERWVADQTQKAKEGYEIHLQKLVSLRPTKKASPTC